MAEPLNNLLFHEWDDEQDVDYKNILDDLLTQKTTPAQAADALDAWVTDEATKRHDNLKLHFQNLQEKGEAWEPPQRYVGDGMEPHYAWDMISESLAKVCSAYPPGSTVHDTLIEMLHQLRDHHKHDVPSARKYTYRDDNPVFDLRETLWDFEGSLVNYTYEFRRAAAELIYRLCDIDNLGDETQLRWRNFQSFVARLTTMNLLDCTMASCPHSLLPGSHLYPNLQERPVAGSLYLTAQLIGAAFWFESDEARDWVYRKCMEEKKESGFQAWTKERWERWKAQFGFIAGLEACSEDARNLAKSLQEKMEAHSG